MSRPQTVDLSSTHIRILTCLSHLAKQNGIVSVNDLVISLDLAGASSLVRTLRIMQRNGFMKIIGGGERGKRQSIVLTPKGKAALGDGGIPVLGLIPAGPLAEALANCEEVIDLGTALPYQIGDFLLIVNGCSMIGDGILPGDKVLLRPNVQVQNGEIAAVYYGEQYEATLKHIYFNQDSHITLRASNEDFQDITVSGKELQVAGVFRGLIRTI